MLDTPISCGKKWWSETPGAFVKIPVNIIFVTNPLLNRIGIL